MNKTSSFLSKKNLVLAMVFLITVVSLIAVKAMNKGSSGNEPATTSQNNTSENPLARGEIVNKNFTREIPMRMIRGQLFVDLKINGKKYNFMYDTGAFTLFSKKLVEELQLEKFNKSGTLEDSSGGKSRAEIYSVPLMEFGGVEFADFSVISHEVDLVVFECLKIDGLIGINMMAALYTKLDYKNKKIVISDYPFDETGYTAIKFKIGPTGGIYLPILFEFGDNLFHLDTGFTGHISISGLGVIPSIEPFKYRSRKKRGIVGANVNGLIEGETVSYIAKNIKLGGIEIKSSPVEVVETGNMLLGNALLQNFDIIFNIPKNTVALRKAFGDEVALSFPDTESNTFGISLLWDPDRKLFVSSLEEKTLAAQEGIMVGDRVVAINGKDTSSFTKNEYCNLFLNYEKEYNSKKKMDITIVKYGEEKNYSLTKQNVR